MYMYMLWAMAVRTAIIKHTDLVVGSCFLLLYPTPESCVLFIVGGSSVRSHGSSFVGFVVLLLLSLVCSRVVSLVSFVSSRSWLWATPSDPLSPHFLPEDHAS